MSLGQFGFLYVAMDAGLSPGSPPWCSRRRSSSRSLIAAGALRERRPGPSWSVSGRDGRAGRGGLGRGGDVPLAALVLCLLGALSWGVGNVVSRASGVRGGLALTVWSAAVVPVPLLALSLLVDGPSGVADGLGAFGWQAAALDALHRRARLAGRLRHLQRPAGALRRAAVVPWILLAPVVAMVSAAALLGDVPDRRRGDRRAVMVSGVLVAVRVGGGRRPQRPDSV